MRLPPKLSPGDEIRVVALSRTLGGVMKWNGTTEQDIAFATARLETLGQKVSFGKYVPECNEHLTASPEHRLEDFHAAIADPSVKGILAVTGGAGAIQILDGIDYDLVAAHPKIICGYSDISFPGFAILARTGLVTYYGAHFTSFMMQQGADYLLDSFRQCLFSDAPYELLPATHWSDDNWPKDQVNRTFQVNEGLWCIQSGEAEGTMIAGAYWALNVLQGSKFFPPLRDAILFLEFPAEGKPTLIMLDTSLRALAFQLAFAGVRGIVLGRYARNGRVTREKLTKLIREIPALRGLPVIANCDFGHTAPIATLPNGGKARIIASEKGCRIFIERH
jgi:muramoyltetrapeptide carboxypeptidase